MAGQSAPAGVRDIMRQIRSTVPSPVHHCTLERAGPPSLRRWRTSPERPPFGESWNQPRIEWIAWRMVAAYSTGESSSEASGVEDDQATVLGSRSRRNFGVAEPANRPRTLGACPARLLDANANALQPRAGEHDHRLRCRRRRQSGRHRRLSTGDRGRGVGPGLCRLRRAHLTRLGRSPGLVRRRADLVCLFQMASRATPGGRCRPGHLTGATRAEERHSRR
jgi:hypothetical protein